LGIIDYVKIGAPSTFMICLDWWAWELNLMFSGYFGVTQQATQIILMQIIALAYMFAIGLEESSCAIIGH
jgi:multidrug resistance protein, MATE family